MILFSFIVLLGTIAWATASLRTRRGDALGIPLVAIGSFFYLYVLEGFQDIRTGFAQLLLTDWQIAKALLIPAVMLASFMWGWLHPEKQKPRSHYPMWNPNKLWWVGFLSAFVGLGLYFIFIQRSGGIVHAFSKQHGQAMAWETNTAYLYDGPWLMLSGSVMMILGNSCLPSSNIRKYMPYIFLAVFLSHAILTGSRGPLFSTVTGFFVANSLAKQKAVSLVQAITLLAVLGCGVLAMLVFRNNLHLGGESSNAPTLNEALNTALGSASTYGEVHGTSGQEFIFHASTLNTVDQTGKLSYGIGWITFLVINPIPRLLWPEKHYPALPGITGEDIQEHSSLKVAGGSAYGLVADAYSNFSIFAALFFYALGRITRRLFISAQHLESPFSIVGYVMIYALSLNIFMQGFVGNFVPFGLSMAPVILLAWNVRTGQRRVIRQPQPAMQRMAALVRRGL